MSIIKWDVFALSSRLYMLLSLLPPLGRSEERYFCSCNESF